MAVWAWTVPASSVFASKDVPLQVIVPVKVGGPPEEVKLVFHVASVTGPPDKPKFPVTVPD
jgi:hypothetical protein